MRRGDLLIKRFRYRVAINNNFKKLYAYLDFKKFGVVTDFVAFSGNSTGPNEEETSEGIGIYLNYKLVKFVTSKAEAIKVLETLIENCPQEAKKDYEQNKHMLLKGLK